MPDSVSMRLDVGLLPIAETSATCPAPDADRAASDCFCDAHQNAVHLYVGTHPDVDLRSFPSTEKFESV